MCIYIRVSRTSNARFLEKFARIPHFAASVLIDTLSEASEIQWTKSEDQWPKTSAQDKRHLRKR
jgi:hypothetical protein